MCGGKGGTSTQSQSSSVQIPQEVLNRYRDINTQAQDVASQPFVSYPGQMVAPVNSTQSGAVENITQAAGIQNQWVPQAYQSLSGGLNNAASAYGAAPGAAAPYNQMAGGLIGGSIASAAPITGQNINQYMSPYTQDVVNATTGWLNQQNKQQQNDLRTSAIQNGAFGGDRSQIASGVLSGQQNLANASTISGLYNQNYSQALAAAQQQQGVQVGAQQQGAQLASGLGNQVFNQGLASGQAWQGLGTQGAQAYAGLGTQQLGNVLAQGQAQLAGGTLYQQTQQAQDQAYYNQFLQQQAYPFQTTQFLANIAEGTGPLYGSSTTAQGSSTTPQPFFSDDKLKENVRTIGHTKDGLRIIRYNHKDDPDKLLRIGFLASDVEKKMPEAVTKHEGLRAVDYNRAARAAGGGLVNPAAAGMPYASGALDLGPHALGMVPDAPPAEPAAPAAPPVAMLPIGANAGVSGNVGDAGVGEGGSTGGGGSAAAGVGDGTGGDGAGGGTYASGGLVPRAGYDAGGEALGGTLGGVGGGLVGSIWGPVGSIIGQHGGKVAGEAGADVIGGDWGRAGGVVLKDALSPPKLAQGGRTGYAAGGAGSYDPQAMAEMLALHQAMFPGAAGRPGIGGSGPRGMQLPASGSHQLIKPEQMRLAPEKQKESGGDLRQVAKDVNDVNSAGKGIGGLYSEGKDWMVGSAGTGAPGDKNYVAPSGGLVGTGGSYDWDKGWLGRNTAGVLGSGTGSSGIASTTLPAPDPTDIGAWAANGGRIGRAGGGGLASSMPYNSGGGGGYVPEELYQPADPQTLAAQRSTLSSPSSSSGGGSGLGNLASLASLGKMGAQGLSSLGGLFGGAGADGLPMSGLGGMTGDAAAGAAGAFGAADAGAGAGAALEMLPMLALARGGRAGFEGGGVPDDEVVPTQELAEAPVPLVPTREEPKAAGVAPAAKPVPSFKRAKEYPAEAPPAAGIVPDLGEGPGRYVDERPPAEAPKAAGVAPAPTPVQEPPGFRQPGGGSDAFGQAVGRTFGHEGGFNPRDANGAPVNMGINQAFHPGVDVKNLTKDQARDIYRKEYWDAIGGDQLDPKIRDLAFDTAVISGPERAKQFLQQSGGDPAKFLELRKQFEEGLVKSDPARYGKYADTWATRRNSYGGNAMALNAPAPASPADAAPGLAGPAVGTGQGLAPPQPDWLDRNEKYIVPALSFLGNMLSSPSRTFAGALGSGMVGAAQALPSQTKIGQEQQRIEIARNAQYMNQWAQLRQIYNTQIANSPSGKADPAIVAAMNRMAGLIGVGAVDGSTPASGGPAGGQNQPAGAGAGPSSGGVPAPGAAPAPGQIGTQPLPAPGATPTPTPVQPGQPATVPPSMRVPTVDFTPEFEAQLTPTMRPSELRRRAGEMTDAGQAADMRRRADQVQADIMRDRGGQGPNGFVPLPSAGGYHQSQERIGDNLRWQTEQTPVHQQRQILRNNIQQIAKTVETFEPGEFARFKADFQAALNGADFKPHSTATMNAEQYQTFMKNAANVIVGSPTNDAKTDAAREIMRTGFADPHLMPGAVKHILAQSLGNLDYADKYFNDVTENMNKAPHINRAMRAKELEDAGNTPERHQAEHEKDIAVRGATPEKAGELEPGQAYIVEPVQAKAWGLPGITKPTKLRFKGVEPDGRVRFGRIQ